MTASAKQKVYAEILFFALPGLRNRETWPFWRRLRSVYAETELIHNIPPLIVEPEFSVHDVHWLNCQALNYWRDGRNDVNYPGHIERIRKLIALVPSSLRDGLQWSGP